MTGKGTKGADSANDNGRHIASRLTAHGETSRTARGPRFANREPFFYIRAAPLRHLPPEPNAITRAARLAPLQRFPWCSGR
ncbi:MAG: hypothetical protein ACLPPF_05380, partial [Rhodomicrobium sp.]